MLLDQETLRFIFGVKLRTLRQQQGLSLVELARASKLSASYLNEIEKGKKYPKADKILELAKALDVAYDDLISLKLKELGSLSRVLEKNLIRGLPFDVFGIPAQTLFELMAERPLKFGALVGTILELARNYHMNVEEFFFATLRAYLDMHGNYFPDLEEAAADFRRRALPRGELTPEVLERVLADRFARRVRQVDFAAVSPELRDLYFFCDRDGLFLNRRLDEREKRFILLKEIAHAQLALGERLTSPAASPDSFEKLLNNFKASYFSSAVLIPREPFVREVAAFFDRRRWDGKAFQSWILGYPGPIESFFHRLSQVLPAHFQVDELFFFRFLRDRQGNLELSRQLHLAELHDPHRTRESEHYCRRWLPTALLAEEKRIVPGAQRARFFGTGNEYLCFTVAAGHPLDASRRTSFTLGIPVTATVRRKIRFVDDPALPLSTVGESCERCGVADCRERAAAANILSEREQDERVQRAMRQVVAASA